MMRAHAAMLVAALTAPIVFDPQKTEVKPAAKKHVRVRLESDFSRGKGRGIGHPCTRRSWERRRQRA